MKVTLFFLGTPEEKGEMLPKGDEDIKEKDSSHLNGFKVSLLIHNYCSQSLNSL